MTQAQKRRLGRGLAALIGDDASEDTVVQDARGLRHLPVELLHPNPNNPRKAFREVDLEDLARSIKDKGLLQPIVARRRADGEYEIVAGERRWRAAQKANIHEVPVIIREVSDAEALEIALVENIQRADLNPLDEARAFVQLMEQFGHTQQQLADSLGKSRSHIANATRLLTLPQPVQSLLESGKLSAGHARALVASPAPAELAERILKLELSVRETEEMVRNQSGQRQAPKPQAINDTDTRALEKQITDAIGLKVDISDKGRAGGRMTIRYKTLDQLDEVCRRLMRSA